MFTEVINQVRHKEISIQLEESPPAGHQEEYIFHSPKGYADIFFTLRGQMQFLLITI